jgi:hypothetical protein
MNAWRRWGGCVHGITFRSDTVSRYSFLCEFCRSVNFSGPEEFTLPILGIQKIISWLCMDYGLKVQHGTSRST